jgi:hypothetical protein
MVSDTFYDVIRFGTNALLVRIHQDEDFRTTPLGFRNLSAYICAISGKSKVILFLTPYPFLLTQLKLFQKLPLRGIIFIKGFFQENQADNLYGNGIVF